MNEKWKNRVTFIFGLITLIGFLGLWGILISYAGGGLTIG